MCNTHKEDEKCMHFSEKTMRPRRRWTMLKLMLKKQVSGRRLY